MSKKKKRMKKLESKHLPLGEKKGTNHLVPAFCFKELQATYDVDKCTKDEQIKLIKSIVKRKSMTWHQITLADKHGLGTESITHFSINIPKQFTDLTFLAFRLGGDRKSTFIGYRRDQIFYIVWVDPKGKVYKH